MGEAIKFLTKDAFPVPSKALGYDAHYYYFRAQTDYLRRFTGDLKASIAALGTPTYITLLPTIELYDSIAAYRLTWATISEKYSYTARPDRPVSVSYIFDTKRAATRTTRIVTNAFREWYDKFVRNNPILSDAQKDAIFDALTRLTGRYPDINFSELVEHGRLPQATIRPEFPTNALGTIKPIERTLTSRKDQAVYGIPVEIGGKQVTAWLVPGSTRLEVDGRVLKYGVGGDYIIKDGLIYLKEPLPEGKPMFFSGQYVEGSLQVEIPKFAPFFSGKIIGLPGETNTSENYDFFAVTGISPNTWNLVLEHLKIRGKTFDSLTAEQQQVLIDAVVGYQNAYDVMALSAYQKESIMLPRLTESTRIPPIRFWGLKYLGWLHIFDEGAPKFIRDLFGTKSPSDLIRDISRAGKEFEGSISTLVSSILAQKVPSGLPNPQLIEAYVDHGAGLVKAYTETLPAILEAYGLSWEEIQVYTEIFRVYGGDFILRTIFEELSMGLIPRAWPEVNEGEDPLVAKIEDRMRGFSEYMTKRILQAQSGFLLPNEILDSILSQIVPYRPSSLLHKESAHQAQEAINEHWESVKGSLREELIAGLSKENIQNLPSIRSVLEWAAKIVSTSGGPVTLSWKESAGPLIKYGEEGTSTGILEKLDPISRALEKLGIRRTEYGKAYSLVEWYDHIATIQSEGSRQSVEAYVNDVLEAVAPMVRSIVRIMGTRPLFFWPNLPAFVKSGKDLVDVLALAIKQSLVGTPAKIKIPGSSPDDFLEMFATTALAKHGIEVRATTETPDDSALLGALEKVANVDPLLAIEMGRQLFRGTEQTPEETEILARAVSELRKAVLSDPGASEIYMRILTADQTAWSTDINALGADLIRALESNPGYTTVVLKAVSTPRIQPVSSSLDTSLNKVRAAVLGTIADPSRPSIPRNEAEQVAYMESGWEAILGWLSPVLAKEFDATVEDARFLLSDWKDAFLQLIDSTIRLERRHMYDLLDPKGELTFRDAAEARLAADKPVFRMFDSIREDELPLLAREVCPKLLEFARGLGAAFLRSEYHTTPPGISGAFITPDEADKLMRANILLVAEEVPQHVHPLFSLGEVQAIRRDITQTLTNEWSKQFEELREQWGHGIDYTSFQVFFNSQMKHFRERMLALVSPWSPKPAESVAHYSKPKPVPGADYLDVELPRTFRFEPATQQQIESAVVQIREKWIETAREQPVWGDPSKAYSNIFDNVNWVYELGIIKPSMEYGGGVVEQCEHNQIGVRLPSGELRLVDLKEATREILGADIEELYRAAKEEFFALTDSSGNRVIDSLLRAILYNQPISMRTNENGTLVDIYGTEKGGGGIVWTCYRWLTKHFEEYFRAKIMGTGFTIKFQRIPTGQDINLEGVTRAVGPHRYNYLLNALLSKNGLIYQRAMLISATVGFSESRQFWNDAVNAFNELYTRMTSGIDVVNLPETEWADLAARIISRYCTMILPLVTQYKEDGSLEFFHEAAILDNPDLELYPLHLRLAWIRDAASHPTAPGAYEVIQKGTKYLEMARVPDPKYVNERIEEFAVLLRKLVAGATVGPDTKLSTRSTDMMSRSYIESLYWEVIYPLEQSKVLFSYEKEYASGEVVEQLVTAKDVILKVDNIDVFDVIKFMYEHNIYVPGIKEDVGPVIDGFRRVLQMALTNPDLAIFARIWDGVRPYIIQVTTKSFLDAVNPANWGTYLRVSALNSQAESVLESLYTDAWGRVYSPIQAENAANYDWMVQLLRQYALTKEQRYLDRFDTMFDLIWKPFMDNELKYRVGRVPPRRPDEYNIENPLHFTVLGNELLSIRELVTRPDVYFPFKDQYNLPDLTRPAYGTPPVETDTQPSEPVTIWSGEKIGGDVKVTARVTMSDGTVRIIDFYVSEDETKIPERLEEMARVAVMTKLTLDQSKDQKLISQITSGESPFYVMLVPGEVEIVEIRKE